MLDVRKDSKGKDHVFMLRIHSDVIEKHGATGAAWSWRCGFGCKAKGRKVTNSMDAYRLWERHVT